MLKETLKAMESKEFVLSVIRGLAFRTESNIRIEEALENCRQAAMSKKVRNLFKKYAIGFPKSVDELLEEYDLASAIVYSKEYALINAIVAKGMSILEKECDFRSSISAWKWEERKVAC